MQHTPKAGRPNQAICGAPIRVQSSKRHQITPNCRSKGQCPACKRREARERGKG